MIIMMKMMITIITTMINRIMINRSIIKNNSKNDNKNKNVMASDAKYRGKTPPYLEDFHFFPRIRREDDEELASVTAGDSRSSLGDAA